MQLQEVIGLCGTTKELSDLSGWSVLLLHQALPWVGLNFQMADDPIPTQMIADIGNLNPSDNEHPNGCCGKDITCDKVGYSDTWAGPWCYSPWPVCWYPWTTNKIHEAQIVIPCSSPLDYSTSWCTSFHYDDKNDECGVCPLMSSNI